MALVQWKQISPQLSDYGHLTGSLEISGSLLINGEMFTGGGGSVQTLSLNGYELSISQGNTVVLPSSSAADTGSLIVSASSEGNRITFTKGDGSSFDITIDTGSAGGSTDIPALNAFTASYELDSSSFDSRIKAINVSGDTSFNGNKVVSNTLLGDLYTSGFNAGTSGSIQQFLEAVFFPTAAPTATFLEQTSYFNTNLATTGNNLNSITITDIVDDSPYNVVISGPNASSFVAVPMNAASSSWEIQANSNLSAGIYTYNVEISDKNASSRSYTNKSITIAQATSGTLSPTGTLYIIESATNGPIYLNSNGRTGAQGGAQVTYSPNYGSQSATNFSSTNPLIAVNSTTGLLSVGTPVSGSGNLAGSTLHTDISYNDQYGNANTSSISVNVAVNNAPVISEVNNTANLNTNLAVSGALLCTISFSDPEGDAINYDSFTFQDASNKLVATRDNTVFQVRSNTDLDAATYAFVSTISDVHGFRTTSAVHSLTINQASNGTLTGDTNIYIVESALSSSAFRDATGYNNGNPAQIGVSYVPNYGSQVASFISSNPAIVVDSSGYLTLGVHLSGSITQSGETFNSTITWNDQYGNTDSSTIVASVFSNQAPAVSYTVQSYNTEEAVSGSNIGSVVIADAENNSPFSLSLGDSSASLFNAVPLNAISSSWNIQPLSNLEPGNYPLSVTVTDTYSKQATISRNIEVTLADTSGLYIYDVGQSSITYNNDIGIVSTDSSVPPIASSYTGVGFLEKIEDGNLGSSSFTYNWGSTVTAQLLASATGANVNTILTDLGPILRSNSNRFVIIMPSGSSMSGVPRTTTDGYGSSIEDEYVLEVAVDGVAIGSGLGTTEASNIHKIILNTPVNGISNYIMVGPQNIPASATSIELRLIAASGSAV